MKSKVFILFIVLIFGYVFISAWATGDNPGRVTIDSCRTNGETFIAKGKFSDADGVSKITFYTDGHYRGGNDKNNLPKGDWYIELAVHDGYPGKSFTLKVVITDSNGNTTSTSKTCNP